ncbi:O-antigen ligase family protein [Anaerococcus sp. AGMB00486]|uniref:O-antigen ligase family protein n=1 Tax=Anaerococcus faecalis TaxID=2742993 RepID=A0ABX2NA24_9FIRM|nr:O-antigen ligase family protein [Anaerococcus faecalis]NVF11541.1 O-antigen ligase family protein [Anaerococcus faecalis]
MKFVRFRYIKLDYIKENLLFFWLIQIVILTGVRFLLTRFGIYGGFYRELLLITLSSFPIIILMIFSNYLDNKSITLFILLLVVVIISILMSYIFYPGHRYFILRPDYGILRFLKPDGAIFAFLFFIINDKSESIYRALKKFAIIYILYLVIVQWSPAIVNGYWEDISYDGSLVKRNYSLTFGYSVALASILYLYFYFKEKRGIYLLLSIFGYYMIFSQGSRGALILPIIFIILYIISGILWSNNSNLKLLKIIILLAFLGIIVFFGNIVITNLARFLVDIGFDSRNLISIASEDFSNDTGRSTIWGAVINGIKTSPIIGLGFFGDRPWVFPYHYAAYSHNLFLELISNFGIFGYLDILIIVFLSIYMIFFSKDKEWRDLFIIFFSLSCQLITSYSYWYVFEFWAMLAIAIKYIFFIKNKSDDIVLGEI